MHPLEHESHTKSNRFNFLIIAVLLTLLGFLVLILLTDPLSKVGRDWTYFNGLSLIVKSNILHYHTFPLQDPYSCGGLDLLSNPQSRILSPLGLLDLMFSPQKANLLSLYILHFFGLIAGFQLFKHLGLGSFFSWIGAFLFVSGSWFGLHFSEGHIIFGPFQLLPWILLLALRLSEPSSAVLLSFLLSFFLVSGATYTFIYSSILTVLVYLFGLASFRDLLTSIRQKPWNYAGALATLCLISSAKVIPVLWVHQDRHLRIEAVTVPFETLIRAWFWPFQSIWYTVPGAEAFTKNNLLTTKTLLFHEVGCYLGIPAFLILFWALCQNKFRKENSRYLWLMLLWLWIATNWIYWINPWRFYKKVPFLSDTHAQSRFLLLFYLFFIILLVKALAMLPRRRLAIALGIAICAEILFVKNYTFYNAHTKGKWNPPEIAFVQHTTVEETLKSLPVMRQYVLHNRAVKTCYEPAVNYNSPVRHSRQKGYRGEAYTSSGRGWARLKEYTPAHIRLEFKLRGWDSIHINTRALPGWKVIEGPAAVTEPTDGVLTLKPFEKQGNLTLAYRPSYLGLVIPMYISGIALGTFLLYRTRLGRLHG